MSQVLIEIGPLSILLPDDKGAAAAIKTTLTKDADISPEAEAAMVPTLKRLPGPKQLRLG